MKQQQSQQRMQLHRLDVGGKKEHSVNIPQNNNKHSVARRTKYMRPEQLSQILKDSHSFSPSTHPSISSTIHPTIAPSTQRSIAPGRGAPTRVPCGCRAPGAAAAGRARCPRPQGGPPPRGSSALPPAGGTHKQRRKIKIKRRKPSSRPTCNTTQGRAALCPRSQFPPLTSAASAALRRLALTFARAAAQRKPRWRRSTMARVDLGIRTGGGPAPGAGERRSKGRKKKSARHETKEKRGRKQKNVALLHNDREHRDQQNIRMLGRPHKLEQAARSCCCST